MPSFKIILAYEGTRYCGWQRNRQQPTLQLALEQAFAKLHWPLIELEGASRTDAGVHATGQVVRADLACELHNLNRAQVGLNSQLPPDIRVQQIERCCPYFHPTLNAIAKTYEYHIEWGRSCCPLSRHTTWHLPYPLDLQAMEQAACYFLGTHDFEAFTNAKKQESYPHYRRTLYNLDLIVSKACRMKIVVRGNHFLYKMVRNIVGTLVMVGRGKLDAHSVPLILQSKDRRQAPLTAPAHGLVLTQIDYPPQPSNLVAADEP